MGKKTSWTEARVRKLRALIRSKKTMAEVAEELDVSYAAVTQQASRLGLTRKFPKKPATGTRPKPVARTVRIVFELTEDEDRMLRAAAALAGQTAGRFAQSALGGTGAVQKTVMGKVLNTLKKATR